MSVLFRRLFRTAIFSRFSKVATATSNFMNEFYNGGFAPEFSVSMLKEINLFLNTLMSWIARKLKVLICLLAKDLRDYCWCMYKATLLDFYLCDFEIWKDISISVQCKLSALACKANDFIIISRTKCSEKYLLANTFLLT